LQFKPPAAPLISLKFQEDTMFRVVKFVVFATPSSAMVCKHVYSDMAAFNFPVEADVIRKFINPALELDSDSNGQAWVSVVTSKIPKTVVNGVPVPFIFPLEVQVRTYVTGPSSRSEERVKGFWLFDLLLHEPVLPSGPDVVAARSLFADTTRVATGKIAVAHRHSSYSATSTELQVTDNTTADFVWSGSVSSEPVSVPDDFFLKRDAWFSQDDKGQLFMSHIRDQEQATPSTKLSVDEFSSTVLQRLSLGNDFGTEVFSQYPESALFIGALDIAFESSELVSAGSVSV
jgi:hypothetical protein